MRSTRRRWLVAAAASAGLGVAGWQWSKRDRSAPVAAPASGPAVESAEQPLAIAPAGMLAVVDASQHFTIVARRIGREVAPEGRTGMLAYEVEQAGKRFLNPVLRVRRGASINAEFWNQLDQTSIVHWHGLRVDANNDGNPHYAVAPGELYSYRIPVRNRAGTCWYHPHPHALTASQVYRGLASFLIVQDEDDDALARALDLKLGVTDIPLLLQDRRIDAEGNFARNPDAADLFLGMVGATAVVNYLRGAELAASPRIYRLRLLNGASARVLRLALVHEDKALAFTTIGADGGLLAQPLRIEEAFLGPGERLDVLLDLRGLPPGAQVVLRSLGFDAMRDALGELCRSTPAALASGIKAQPGAASALAPESAATRASDGAALDLLRIVVAAGPPYERATPPRLSDLPAIGTRGAKVRSFLLDHQRMRWSINGVRFDMLKTQLSVARDAVEIWEFRNPPGGMPHPVHMHGFPFRMLERRGSPEQVRRLALDGSGLAAPETGWKDTFLLWPGERVRVAIDFTHDYAGEQVYMLHCHNLEHEDQGMMLNVRIVPRGQGENA